MYTAQLQLLVRKNVGKCPTNLVHITSCVTLAILRGGTTILGKIFTVLFENTASLASRVAKSKQTFQSRKIAKVR